MIISIKFKEDYVCFFKGNKFKLKPITLLVGDQGCGKSTMLHAIKDRIQRNEKGVFECEFDDTVQNKIMHLDLEKDNPRTDKSRFNPNNSDDMFYSLSVGMGSHGEALLPILKLIEDTSDSLIMLDEPETSLSLRSQYKLIEMFKDALTRNNQIILATHNIVFMEAFPDCVLSLEHKKYMSPRMFTKAQKQESTFKRDRQDKMIKKTKCRLGVDCKCAEEKGFYNYKCEHYVLKGSRYENWREHERFAK